jgi:hypothetical protein
MQHGQNSVFGEETARIVQAFARAEQLLLARAAVRDEYARRLVVFIALRGRQGVPAQGDETKRGGQRLAPIHIERPDRIERI